MVSVSGIMLDELTRVLFREHRAYISCIAAFSLLGLLTFHIDRQSACLGYSSRRDHMISWLACAACPRSPSPGLQHPLGTAQCSRLKPQLRPLLVSARSSSTKVGPSSPAPCSSPHVITHAAHFLEERVGLYSPNPQGIDILSSKAVSYGTELVLCGALLSTPIWPYTHAE